LFIWGVTIPRSYEKGFFCERVKTSRKIQIIWGNKTYPAILWHAKRKKYPVYQLRWDNRIDLLTRLRITFIQSYVILESQKELHQVQKAQKQFRSRLPGGQQEVLIIKPLSPKKIKFETFIKIESPLNSLFERFVKENVFGWLFPKEKEYLITKSTSWISIKELRKHIEATNVIYFLADTKKKEFYIGSARRLGDRVIPGRKEIKGWNRFRYDIIKPDFSKLLRRIEFHTIRTVASLLRNQQNFSTLGLDRYKLKNKNWEKV